MGLYVLFLWHHYYCSRPNIYGHYLICMVKSSRNVSQQPLCWSLRNLEGGSVGTVALLRITQGRNESGDRLSSLYGHFCINHNSYYSNTFERTVTKGVLRIRRWPFAKCWTAFPNHAMCQYLSGSGTYLHCCSSLSKVRYRQHTDSSLMLHLRVLRQTASGIFSQLLIYLGVFGSFACELQSSMIPELWTSLLGAIGGRMI